MKKLALIISLLLSFSVFVYAGSIGNVVQLSSDITLSDVDEDTDIITDPDTDEETGEDTDEETGSDIETDTETDTDTATATDTQMDSDSDSESDSDIETDVESDTDSDEVVIESISVSGVRTSYTKGDKFDDAGYITVRYSDGTTKKIAMDESYVSGFTTSSTGDKTVKVTYKGKSDEYTIKVSASSSGPSKQEILQMLDDSDDEKPASTKTSFVDVFTTDWYYSAVLYASNNGLMSGMSQNEFGPNYNVTRAMLITILYRNAGQPAAGGSVFSDVADGEWYAPAVMWGYDKGIVSGMTSTTFEPSASITREQLAVMLYNYAQFRNMNVALLGDISGYSDSNLVADWSQSAVKWAVGNGLITGRTDGTLDPKGFATRAEVATILMRFLQK